MLRTPHPIAVIYLSLVLYACRALSLLCNPEIYGIPDPADCLNAYYEIPYANQPPATSPAQQRQLFCEPQFLSPPFKSVLNRYSPLPIVQLPKIWRHKTCFVAFMTNGQPNMRASNPLFGSNWRDIIDTAQAILGCTSGGRSSGPSGGWAPLLLQHTGKAAAALYIYTSGSLFESMVNHYMSQGWPIIPPNSETDLAALANLTSPLTNTGPNLSAILQMPLVPGDVKLLD
ncbi:hypothetical protein MMC28_006677 [Mycoblastus sanguinarius]|nr:hypothetical protein [Mycoblastus sanguinarius]